MVALIYALILVPVIFHLIFFGYETWVALRLLRTSKSSGKSYLYTLATAEVSHTVLVYAFATFMTTHATMLPDVATKLFPPIALLMVALMVRACAYMALFYSEQKTVAKAWGYSFLATYIGQLVALVWGVVVVLNHIIVTNYTPDTQHAGLFAAGAVLVLPFLIYPTYRVYRVGLGRK